ncbi:MAG: nucleoside triphosphate pyrophosphohydrolase [Candidatus Gracilibacteria bacterium]|nr:nucleoside triphosphate pyrophosphohydrolase [Candidatus Gracilibacteria bacterium]
MKKLVRDKIPEIIASKGEKCEYFIADDNSYEVSLLAKILEEAIEVSKAENDTELKEEIADLYEVIDAFIKYKNFSHEEILEIQKQKREKKGGFEKKIILTKY